MATPQVNNDMPPPPPAAPLVKHRNKRKAYLPDRMVRVRARTVASGAEATSRVLFDTPINYRDFGVRWGRLERWNPFKLDWEYCDISTNFDRVREAHEQNARERWMQNFLHD